MLLDNEERLVIENVMAFYRKGIPLCRESLKDLGTLPIAIRNTMDFKDDKSLKNCIGQLLQSSSTLAFNILANRYIDRSDTMSPESFANHFADCIHYATSMK